MVVAPVQDLQQRAPLQLGMLVGLHEPAGPHPGAELGLAGVADRGDRAGRPDRPVLDVGVAAAGGEQPQEVGLARAVAAQDGDPLAVPDLEVEGPHQPAQLEVLADHGPLAGATTLEPHLHLLLARLLGRRAGLLELAQPGLRGLVAAGHVGVVGRLLLVHQHLGAELGVLLVPALAELLEAREAVPGAPRGTTRSHPDGSTPGCRRRRARPSRPGSRCCRAARGRG